MHQTVLFYDTSRSQARDLRSVLASAGCRCEIPKDDASFSEALEAREFSLLVYALEHHHLVRDAMGRREITQPVILLTNSRFEDLSPLLLEIAATNIIAKNPDGTIRLRDLLSTVRKIFDDDIFGVKHYLSFGTRSEVFHIRDSRERGEYIETVVDFCKRLHLRSSVIQSVELFCEELLMNAIYDAPRDEEGKMLYNSWSRKDTVTLKPKQAARMEFACDGEKLVVSISDPFGGMTWDVLQTFLIRCFGSERKISNFTEQGGAGLGLYFCFASVNTFVVNVDPEKKSEFIGIFDIAARPQQRQSRYSSLHFFSTQNKVKAPAPSASPSPATPHRKRAG